MPPVAGLLVLRDVSGRSGVYRQEICPDEASSTTSSTILPSYLCPPAHHVIFPQQAACFALMIIHDITSSLFHNHPFLSFSLVDCFDLEILLVILQRFLAIDFGFMDNIDFIGFFCFTDLAALEYFLVFMGFWDELNLDRIATTRYDLDHDNYDNHSTK